MSEPTRPVEEVSVASLKPHPRNYRKHTKRQLEHLCKSIKDHGLYRNVVIAEDSTILAGHGVVEAVMKLGIETIQVIRLNVSPDSDLGLKVLTGDNEISNLVDIDNKELVGILKEIDEAGDLLGTGFDIDGLDALFQRSTPKDFAMEEWQGMPEFKSDDLTPHRQIIVSFESEEAVAVFAKTLNVLVTPKTRSFFFPPEQKTSQKDHEYIEDDEG